MQGNGPHGLARARSPGTVCSTTGPQGGQARSGPGPGAVTAAAETAGRRRSPTKGQGPPAGGPFASLELILAMSVPI